MSTPVSIRWASESEVLPAFTVAGVPERVVRARLVDRRIAVAERASQIVGALQLEYLWGTRPYIALIRVAAEHQREGVGRAMLGFVERALHGEGIGELLSSSQANEPEPQAWHRHMGFVDCGVLHGLNEGGVDEVFFRKPLG